MCDREFLRFTMSEITRKGGLTQRGKLDSVISHYTTLNKKYRMFAPMSFELHLFGVKDRPLCGDRADRKRIRNYNYRERVKYLKHILNERIYDMEFHEIDVAGDLYLSSFEPLMHFTDEDEREIEALDEFENALTSIEDSIF